MIILTEVIIFVFGNLHPTRSVMSVGYPQCRAKNRPRTIELYEGILFRIAKHFGNAFWDASFGRSVAPHESNSKMHGASIRQGYGHLRPTPPQHLNSRRRWSQ